MSAQQSPKTLLRVINETTESLALEPWEKPLPLEDVERRPFPLEAYDDFQPLGSFARELAHFSQTPIDLAAVTLLGTLSAAINGKYEVEIEPGYIEPVNLYILSFLQSGSRKSSVFTTANAPIMVWERTQNTAERIAYATWESRKRVNDAKLRDAERSLSKPSKDGGYATNKDHALQSEALIREIATDKPPRITQLVADDITAERMASLLAEQDGALAIMAAEGGFFSNIGGRYSDMPGLDTLLKGHSRELIRTNRQGRPGESIPRPTMTVCISAQPDIAADLGRIPGFRGKGAAARFLVTMPKSNLGQRKIQVPPMNEKIMQDWHECITRILDIPIAGRDPDDGYPIPWRLRLSKEARAEHVAFREDIEAELGEAGFLAEMTDWASKIAGQAGRIASVLHIADHRFSANPVIGLPTMQAAVQIAEYFMAHAPLFFNAMAGDDGGANSSARVVLEELKDLAASTAKPVTRSSLHQRLRKQIRFKDKTSLDDPLSTLEDHGYIQIVKVATGGRPSETIILNPTF